MYIYLSISLSKVCTQENYAVPAEAPTTGVLAEARGPPKWASPSLRYKIPVFSYRNLRTSPETSGNLRENAA